MLGYILDPTLQVQDVHGGTIAGAKIYLYDSNTSELATSYKDFNGAINTNPIITDTLGNCTVIGVKGQSYDVVFKDANDNLLFSKQNLTIGNGAIGGGNTIVSAGYGIVVTPSVSGNIDNFEVAIDPAVVATISGANAIEAGDNILIKTTASGTKQINVTSAIHLANAVYQSDYKRNGIETQNILTEDYTQVKPDGVRVANDSDDNYFIMNQHAVEGGDGNDLVHLDATSLDIVHDDGTYERQIHLGTAGDADSDWFQGLLIKNNMNSGSLSADTYDVKLQNNTGTYSLTAASQIANSAWSAIVNGDVSANYATYAGSANYATSAGSANYAASAGYATSAGSANYAASASSADYATSAGSATYATNAHTADTLPYGRASWNGPSFQGDKIVAIIDKTNYNYGDVIVTFDIYETLAGMTHDAYRGKLCIDIRRNSDPSYTFYVSYAGKKLNQTTLYVKRDASNKVYVIFNKTNNNYCGVKAVVKSATGWQGHDFTDYITLNDDPAVTDTSSYTNIAINESQPVTAPMGGRGSENNPVYVDLNGVAQQCFANDSVKFASSALPDYFAGDLAGNTFIYNVKNATSTSAYSIRNSIIVGDYDNFKHSSGSREHFDECIFMGDCYMYGGTSGENTLAKNIIIGSNSISFAASNSNNNTVIGADNDIMCNGLGKSDSDTVVGYQNNIWGASQQCTIYGCNNDINLDHLSYSGSQISIFGYNNTWQPKSNSVYDGVIVGNYNNIAQSGNYRTMAVGFSNTISGNCTTLIGSDLSASNEGSWEDQVMKVGFGKCHLEIHSSGTIYKVVNGTKTQI